MPHRRRPSPQEAAFAEVRHARQRAASTAARRTSSLIRFLKPPVPQARRRRLAIRQKAASLWRCYLLIRHERKPRTRQAREGATTTRRRSRRPLVTNRHRSFTVASQTKPNVPNVATSDAAENEDIKANHNAVRARKHAKSTYVCRCSAASASATETAQQPSPHRSAHRAPGSPRKCWSSRNAARRYAPDIERVESEGRRSCRPPPPPPPPFPHAVVEGAALRRENDTHIPPARGAHMSPVLPPPSLLQEHSHPSGRSSRRQHGVVPHCRYRRMEGLQHTHSLPANIRDANRSDTSIAAQRQRHGGEGEEPGGSETEVREGKGE